MRNLDFSKTEITGGFWRNKQKLIADVTAMAVYDRFYETGRIEAFKCNWKEGMENQPHHFWDSDVAKWIEGIAYITAKKKNKKLEALADSIIEDIVKNQGDDGYFNIYYTVVKPNDRFTDRDMHELYCLGHLLEAGIAYYEATGKRKLLDAMIKYVDYVERRFKIDKDTPFVTPGHEEIELALVKLYDLTGQRRYLELSSFFVEERGKRDEVVSDWATPVHYQSVKPVREQREAVGHAVRAVYLYCAMADLALRTDDGELKAVCEDLFEDIITKKMYITGGIGSSSCGEAFTVPYDLSNLLAYTESCAALGLALFANRMLNFGADSKYSDVVERVIYNGFLSSLSLDGTAFFYENPLEVIPYLHTRDSALKESNMHWPQMQRSKVFFCSCCPPNIVRFIPSIANLMYTTDDTTLYVHQFMDSKTETEIGGKRISIRQKTAYPENGKVKITVSGADVRVAVRIPSWFDGYKGETVKGYAYFDVKDGDTLDFDFTMRVKFIEARPEAVFNCGRYAVTKGPIVYCMESVDNGPYLRDIRLSSTAKFKTFKHEALGVTSLRVKAYRRRVAENEPLYSPRHSTLEQMEATLIPYYAFANRGESEMQVWTYIK